MLGCVKAQIMILATLGSYQWIAQNTNWSDGEKGYHVTGSAITQPHICSEGNSAWLPDGYSQIFRSYVFEPLAFWTKVPLRYAAKFNLFLSSDCTPTPSTLAQSKERKGPNFAIWQHCRPPPSGREGTFTQPCSRSYSSSISMLPSYRT